MHKIELKGGNENYHINKVLGPDFASFITLLQNGGLKAFTYQNFNPNQPGQTNNTVQNAKDLHPIFAQYLIAATAAFKEIENPDLEKVNVASKYAENIDTIVNELITKKHTGLINPSVHHFYFQQLPFHQTERLKYLSNVFHYFPYTNRVYPDHNDSENNSLINAIRYLYHIISLLDLNSLDIKELFILLRSDHLQFMDYVNDLTAIFKDNQVSTTVSGLPENSEDIIRDGVIQALEAIANQIVYRLRQVPAANINESAYQQYLQEIRDADSDRRRDKIIEIFKFGSLDVGRIMNLIRDVGYDMMLGGELDGVDDARACSWFSLVVSW